MKKILFSVLALAAISIVAFRPIADPLAIGSSIPNAGTKMKDISGKEVSFKEAMKENGLMVMFSCNTCPVVHKYESRTMESCKKALDNKIGVILLNSNEAYREKGDSYDDMQGYAKKLGYNWNYVVDQNSVMADAFGATRTPEIFLFDKSGKLVYHGAIDDNSGSPDEVTRKHLSIAIDELVAGKTVSTQKTKSVGCTIKRL
ncbi:MAG: thioredoxin family protein [Chitinophagaceae bacterium]|nr:thioredoxin family protein [Chitinophagaceae bacterium]